MDTNCLDTGLGPKLRWPRRAELPGQDSRISALYLLHKI